MPRENNLSASLLLFWAGLGLDYLTNCSTWINLVSSLFLFLKIFVSLQECNLSYTNIIYIISESQAVKPLLSVASSYACKLLKAMLTQVSKHLTLWHGLINTIFGQQLGKI